MNNATLTYIIKSNNDIKSLKLENESLFIVDRLTSNYKSEKDFLNHYYNKDKIDKFIKDNGNIEGKLVISYSLNVNNKEEIEPLYNSNEVFFFKDDPYENKITEVEKARKLLFNSKNQLFTRLILSNNTLDRELNRLIDLSYVEAQYIKDLGIKPIQINNKNYVSFKTLFSYRINSPKLGLLRNAYQEMLNILKEKIMSLDYNSFYFYNRQLRIIIKKYYDLIKEISVDNLKIRKIKLSCKYVLNKSNLKHL